VAISHNAIAMVEFLLTRGRDKSKYKGALNSLEELTNRESTALAQACEHGYEHIVTLLIEAGADVNAKAYAYYELPMTHCLISTLFFLSEQRNWTDDQSTALLTANTTRVPAY